MRYWGYVSGCDRHRHKGREDSHDSKDDIRLVANGIKSNGRDHDDKEIEDPGRGQSSIYTDFGRTRLTSFLK